MTRPATQDDDLPGSRNGQDPSMLRTLDRGLDVLEALAAAPSGLTFSEVMVRVKLSTGTVNRLLQTLVRRGYVEQDKRSKTYRLGFHILELQAANVSANRMAAQARPALYSLVKRTGRRALLATYRGGDHIVYVDRVDNSESQGRYVPPGRGGPVYATSLGKAIMAFERPEVIEDYLAHSKRERLTEKTIVDAEDLRREFAAVRQRGYATEVREQAAQTCCIGAPIFDYTGDVVAAISIAGTPDDIVPHMDSYSAIVVDEAGRISESFGYRPLVASRTS